MSKKIFINLPVANLPKALTFYKALGYVQNMEFSNDAGACMIVSDTIYVMLLTHPKFMDFTKKQIADTQKTVAVINSLSVDSLDEVNAMMKKRARCGCHRAERNPRLWLHATAEF